MSNDHSTRGYIKDASYPTTYFRERSPVWLNYVAALSGAAPRVQPFVAGFVVRYIRARRTSAP